MLHLVDLNNLSFSLAFIVEGKKKKSKALFGVKNGIFVLSAKAVGVWYNSMKSKRKQNSAIEGTVHRFLLVAKKDRTLKK